MFHTSGHPKPDFDECFTLLDTTHKHTQTHTNTHKHTQKHTKTKTDTFTQTHIMGSIAIYSVKMTEYENGEHLTRLVVFLRGEKNLKLTSFLIGTFLN